MAKNLISDGTTYTGPTGTARTKGLLYAFPGDSGSMVGVALDTFGAAEIPTYALTGEWDLAKTAAVGSDFAPGAAVFATTGTGEIKAFNQTATSRIYVGKATETTTTDATTVKVLINFGGNGNAA